MHMLTLPLDVLRQRFELIEGQLFNRKTGKRAGWLGHEGYRSVKINRRTYKEHRVVFALANGHWPTGEVDHVNGRRDDNRPENLREVGRLENILNQNLGTRNPTGRAGVSLHKPTGKWRAQISVFCKRHHLGHFTTREEAQRVYDVAATKRASTYAANRARG